MLPARIERQSLPPLSHQDTKPHQAARAELVRLGVFVSWWRVLFFCSLLKIGLKETPVNEPSRATVASY